FSIVGSLPRDC
nr:Chain B, Glycine receptor subunit beta [Rattus norvegicus]4U91_E Chain E, Glycine receptor subunit beta [Rattus norvegicus]6HSO_D Chain D, Glycine receptor beta subunit derived peptide [Rattus norvegicus]6HSO_I Chain I, Glycine receptor beta subunit derived peptide [Rattus norvegicus]